MILTRVIRKDNIIQRPKYVNSKLPKRLPKGLRKFTNNSNRIAKHYEAIKAQV